MKIIIANLKMYKDRKETIDWVKGLVKNYKQTDKQLLVCPSLVFIDEAVKLIKDLPILVAGQNCAPELDGAFTGEVSVKQLKDEGAGAVVIGHSERRRLFGETNEGVNKKLKLISKAGLVSIVCLGDDGSKGYTLRIRNELKQIFDGFEGDPSKIIIAFEPSWAIGSGKSMAVKDVLPVIKAIRNEAKRILKSDVKVIYGGSVNVESAKEYLDEELIDGLFIGTASKDYHNIITINQM